MDGFSEKAKIYLKEYLLKKRLSKREVEVVMFVVEGGTNRDAAKQLNIAEKTVKFHLTNVYKRLSISRRAQILWALPLLELLELSKDQPNVVSNDNTVSIDNNAEELIPVGSSTVSDQVE